MLGDDRDHSSDSRLFGYVGRDPLGKAMVRIWPFNRAALFDLRPTFAQEP